MNNIAPELRTFAAGIASVGCSYSVLPRAASLTQATAIWISLLSLVPLIIVDRLIDISVCFMAWKIFSGVESIWSSGRWCRAVFSSKFLNNIWKKYLMTPPQRKLLEDMRDAAAKIGAFAQGKSLTEYLSDEQFRWAVERGFEIVGEAMTQLSKLDLVLAQKITDYRKIISFRNVLIHGYSNVNPSITWDIIEKDLPVLRGELEQLLK